MPESLIEQLEMAASRQPEREAVVSPSRRSSFAEIVGKSNRIGRAIHRDEGEGAVALLVEDADSLVAAMYGVLRAGRFWVVLDPRHPPDRSRMILQHAEASAILFDEQQRSTAESIVPEGTCRISLGDAMSEGDERLVARNRDATDVAAISYTSGSTGEPKGVIHTDRFLLELARFTGRSTDRELDAGDRVLFLGSMAFSGALGLIHGSILNGATLQVFPVARSSLIELASWLDEEKATVFQSAPTLFRHLMMTIHPEMRFPHLRQIRLAGDVVSARDVELFQKRFDEACRLLIGFGSSECGPIATHTITCNDPIRGGVVPVGRPLRDISVQLLDDEKKEVPVGTTGEIFVSGSRLASGYWRCSESDAQRFEMVSGREGHLRYRTGDVGRFDENGSLFFCGRKDDQVKVRGFRIEPFEIEATLRTHPAVEDAAVVGSRDGTGDMALRAFVTTRDSVDPAQLRSFVSRFLPDHMVPGTVVVLTELPSTSTGKIDREALESIGTRLSRDNAWRSPEDQIERELLDIWRSVMENPRIAVDDDFFESGGNSIIAARVLAEIERRLGLRIPMASLLEAPTIETQAILLREEGWTRHFDVIVPMRTTGSRPKLFCVAGGGGNVVGFRALVDALGDDQPFYAMQSPSLADDDVVRASLEEIASRFVESARSVQPSGPYFLAGYSSGGAFAYEMAQQLLNQGEQVAFLALLDTAYRTGHRHAMMVRVYRRVIKLLKDPRRWLRNYWKEYSRRRGGRRRNRRNRLNDAFGKTGAIGKPGPQLSFAGPVSRYHEKPFAGRITLVIANRGNEFGSGDSVMRWADLAMGGVDLIRIEGGHFSILKEPAVRDLAAQLRKVMDARIEDGV